MRYRTSVVHLSTRSAESNIGEHIPGGYFDPYPPTGISPELSDITIFPSAVCSSLGFTLDGDLVARAAKPSNKMTRGVNAVWRGFKSLLQASWNSSSRGSFRSFPPFVTPSPRSKHANFWLTSTRQPRAPPSWISCVNFETWKPPYLVLFRWAWKLLPLKLRATQQT